MAQDNGEKFVWFLVGATMGAAVALLYAPQSGDRTRRLISRRLVDGRDALAENGGDLMDRGRELFEKGRRVADDAAEMFERGRKLVQEKI
jgi:gas vesicle protein